MLNQESKFWIPLKLPTCRYVQCVSVYQIRGLNSLKKILHHCIVRREQHDILNWGSIANAWAEMLKPKPICLRCVPLDELQYVCGVCFLFCHVFSTLWTEVFLECVQFPDMIHALKPNPKNHIQENWRIMDFFSNIPESCNMFTFLFDDIGIPADYRHMEGFGVHTFKVHFLALFSIEKQCLGKLNVCVCFFIIRINWEDFLFFLLSFGWCPPILCLGMCPSNEW